MHERWEDMLQRLDGGEASYWRKRLAMAEELVEALQAGYVLEPQSLARCLLLRLTSDAKWEVRKIIANSLNLVGDAAFDEVAARLLSDSNGFVRRSAEQSYRLRRQDSRQAHKRETTDRQLADRLIRLREKHGEAAAQDAMAVSELRLNQLAGAMAHDLRAILSYLMPAATGVYRGLGAGEELSIVTRKASRLVDGLNFMDRCVTDMERYTQPLPVERRAEDLAEVLHAACEIAARNIEELGFDPHVIVLRQEVPDGLRISVSRQLVVLAVANLVKNAYESFMHRHHHLRPGEISVLAQKVEDEVHIAIHDDGMGIAAGDLDDLQSGMPRRRNKAKRKSTGFGIPIARRYIEAHGGTLTFESCEDMGTTALITLPCTPSDCRGDEP